jgi:CHAD domain-containing protein
MSASLPIRVGNASKAARGYALQEPQLVDAVKARPVRLASGMSVEQGFRVVVDNCLTQMQYNERGVMRGVDPESVHQMRVGMRRLRSALRLFAKWMQLPQNLHAELGWLAAELGAARDSQVLADSTLAKVAAACPQETGLAGLRQTASSIATTKRLHAAEVVGSVRYSCLMIGLVGWLQASDWHEAVDDSLRQALAKPIDKRAAQILVRCHQKLIKRGEHLEEGTPEERHQVRIAAKQMFYATEFFQSLHPVGRIRRYIKRLAAP